MSPIPPGFSEQTRASAEAVDRVGARLQTTLSPEDLRLLLHTLPGAAPGAFARVNARLCAPPAARRPVRRPLAVGVGLAFAALAWFAATTLLPDPPVPLDQEIRTASSGEGPRIWTTDGSGHLGGTSAAPLLEWADGDGAFEARTAFAFSTREAAGSVEAGARGQIQRSVMGTRLRVEAGAADLRCLLDGAATHLGMGQEATCLPVSAEGMLGRARALAAEGAETEALAAADLGLARPDAEGDVAAELGVLRITLLQQAGRAAEALAASRAYLAGPSPLRAIEIHRLAAALSLGLEGCAGALPHLEALADVQPDAAARLAACRSQLSDPARSTP